MNVVVHEELEEVQSDGVIKSGGEPKIREERRRITESRGKFTGCRQKKSVSHAI